MGYTARSGAFRTPAAGQGWPSAEGDRDGASRPSAAAIAVSLAILHLLTVAPPAAALDPRPDENRVILIEDSYVYVRSGKDFGSQVGDLFSVTRPGKAIVDPQTGDTLGIEPVSIAKLRVLYAAPHYSRTVALEVVQGVPVQVGDRVVRWDGERIGRVPSPVVVSLEVEEAPTPIRASEGDKVFKEKKRSTGDIVGDFVIDAEILDYDFGDVDGDAVPELVALEERKVTLYRVLGGTLEPIWSETVKGFRYVSMEMYDADGDKREEIYVGQKLGNVSRTDVYGFKDGHVARTGQIKGVFVRQNGDRLFGQRYGFAKPFAGPVMEITYNPATSAVTVVRQVFEGPASCLGLGVGKNRMAYLDFNDRLTITDHSGQTIWRGTQALGGSSLELESGNGREKEKIQKKIMFSDFNGDGAEDLLVVKNELNPLWGMTGILGGLKFKNGKFLIYTDRPGGYDVLKETREFEGYVADYEYTVVGGRDRRLSLCVVSSAGREKFKSRIIVLREL